VSHPQDALHRELAFVAYHFHWSRDEVLDLSHAERARWVAEISAIHERMDEEA
jgi:hypothetical protein